MRTILLSLALLGAAATAVAQPAPGTPGTAQPSDTSQTWEHPKSSDPFVRMSDACGASRYAHLVGAPFATLQQAALPEDAAVHRGGGASRRTLEYTPGKLNVVLDGGGRIAAIGCF